MYFTLRLTLKKLRSLLILTFTFTSLDKKYHISAKTEAVKHLCTVFLLTVEQHRRPVRLLTATVYFTSLPPRGSLLLLGYNISIFHVCMVWIEKSVTRVTDRHHEACRVMPNSDPE